MGMTRPTHNSGDFRRSDSCRFLELWLERFLHVDVLSDETYSWKIYGKKKQPELATLPARANFHHAEHSSRPLQHNRAGAHIKRDQGSWDSDGNSIWIYKGFCSLKHGLSWMFVDVSCLKWFLYESILDSSGFIQIYDTIDHRSSVYSQPKTSSWMQLMLLLLVKPSHDDKEKNKHHHNGKIIYRTLYM